MWGDTTKRKRDELAALALPVVAGSGGRGYQALPSLGRVRWLLPAGEPGARRAGMRELFHPSSLKGRVLKASILSGVVRGSGVGLEEEALAGLEAELAASLGAGDLRLVFYVGTPGAYRKVTAQVLDDRGETLAFAKIAASPPAVTDVEAEHGVLERLSGNGRLDGRIPSPLRLFDWRAARVLLTTGGPPLPGPGRLSGQHLDFYARLFVPFAEEQVFGESRMLERLSQKTEELGGRLPGASDLLHRALARLEEDLGSVTLPLSVAHRDFAPWNTRVGPEGLFVFDWDGARWGTTPLYDLFHFQSIQAVLVGGDSLPDRRPLNEALDGTWPGGHGHLSSLYLAYLLDLSLLYGEARASAPEAGDSKVWDWLLARLEAILNGDFSL